MDKNNYQVYSALAMLYQDQKNYEEAVLYYERALKLGKDKAENYVNLALVLMKLGRNGTAAELFEDAIKLQPDNLAYKLYCANAYSADKNYIKANSLFEEMIATDSKFYHAYICYGISLFEQNGTEKAIDMYNLAIKVSENSISGYLLLGNLYSSEQKFEEAVECYKKVIALQPANVNAYTLLGNTYVMLKDLHSAINIYKQAVDIDSDNDEIKLVYIEIIQEYIKNRDNGEADNAE